MDVTTVHCSTVLLWTWFRFWLDKFTSLLWDVWSSWVWQHCPGPMTQPVNTPDEWLGEPLQLVPLLFGKELRCWGNILWHKWHVYCWWSVFNVFSHPMYSITLYADQLSGYNHHILLPSYTVPENRIRSHCRRASHHMSLLLRERDVLRA